MTIITPMISFIMIKTRGFLLGPDLTFMLQYRQDVLSKSIRIFRMFADFRPFDKILKNEKVWFLSEKFKLTCVCVRACVCLCVWTDMEHTRYEPWLNFVKKCIFTYPREPYNCPFVSIT